MGRNVRIRIRITLGSQGGQGRGLAFGGRLPAAMAADDDASPSRLTASDELIEPSFERDW